MKRCGFKYWMTSYQDCLVPEAGIEPARLAAGDFESPASTNFTTRAVRSKEIIMAQYGL
jgi:hypothetical protein